MTWLWPGCDLVVAWLWLVQKSFVVESNRSWTTLCSYASAYHLWRMGQVWLVGALKLIGHAFASFSKVACTSTPTEAENVLARAPRSLNVMHPIVFVVFPNSFWAAVKHFLKMHGLQPAARQFSCRGVGRLGAGCIVPGLGHNPKHNCYKQK